MVKRPSRRTQSRYVDIEEKLREEIARGDYPIGARIPTEHELCERFDVSRFTVRQALARLRQLGMLESRAGVGSIVKSLGSEFAFRQTLANSEELLQYPPGTFRRHLEKSTVTASAELAMMLRCPPGTVWSKLRAMRVARPSNLPIAWLDVYLQPRFAEIFDAPNPEGAPVLVQIEKTFGHHAAHAQIEIFSSRVSADLAGPLECDPEVPALVILRRYRDADGQIYLVTYSLHPETRFSLNFEFERQ